MTNQNRTNRYFKAHIAVPQDHGSWVFLLSPLLIGMFAGGTLSAATPFLVFGALAAFLVRQPVSILIKALSGRRSRNDLPPAILWTAVYALLGLMALTGLAWLGYGYILYLALPALPVFAWHLWLVSRRAERRQIGVEILGSGVLALAAPAAYWVGVGRPDPIGWWLWGLTWFQSAASIVYAYLRLEQRQLPAVPILPERLRLGRRALIYTSFNFLAVLLLCLLHVLPPWLWLPYALQWCETVYGTLNPAIKAKPTAIGMRQLMVSILFTITFILAW
jgi:hypothetical protein